jgi:hypothetical protein
MSSIDSKKLALGIVLMVSFLAVLVGIFLPLIDGGNTLNWLDNLYNSISKASAYYIPQVAEEVEGFEGDPVTLELELGDAEHATVAETLLRAAGVEAIAQRETVSASGSLGRLLLASVEDADAMYHNRGSELESRYGVAGRNALYVWYATLRATERELTRQKRFDAAKLVTTVNTRAVECAYNYYGIEPQPISERWGIVLFSLVFYVVYTVWYGYAVMYLFEGAGYRLSH